MTAAADHWKAHVDPTRLDPRDAEIVRLRAELDDMTGRALAAEAAAEGYRQRAKWVEQSRCRHPYTVGGRCPMCGRDVL